jgi:hypothetical protein
MVLGRGRFLMSEVPLHGGPGGWACLHEQDAPAAGGGDTGWMVRVGGDHGA